MRQACEAGRNLAGRQSAVQPHLRPSHDYSLARMAAQRRHTPADPFPSSSLTTSTHADEVREAVKSWSLKRDVDIRLDRTDKQLRKGGAPQRRPIIARTQTAVFEHAQGFVALAQKWLDLIAANKYAANDCSDSGRLADARPASGTVASRRGRH